jgi:hypothetical protein
MTKQAVTSRLQIAVGFTPQGFYIQRFTQPAGSNIGGEALIFHQPPVPLADRHNWPLGFKFRLIHVCLGHSSPSRLFPIDQHINDVSRKAAPS